MHFTHSNHSKGHVKRCKMPCNQIFLMNSDITDSISYNVSFWQINNHCLQFQDALIDKLDIEKAMSQFEVLFLQVSFHEHLKYYCYIMFLYINKRKLNI